MMETMNGEVDMPERAFKHEALRDPSRQIRLLQIMDDVGEDWREAKHNMQCSLSTWEFGGDDGPPEYVAISYHWGEPTPSRNILVNDKAFMVRWNCWHALFQSKQHLRPRQYLWIDAICIDQASLAERSAQVSFMDSIFRRATKVHCCVGPAHADSDLFFSCIEKHSTYLSRLALNDDDHRADKSQRRDSDELWCCPGDHTWFHTLLPTHDFPRLSEAAIAVSEREWFRRVWVVQEVAMAKSAIIVCGPFAVTLGAFIHSCQDIEESIFFHSGIYNDNPNEAYLENTVWLERVYSEGADAMLHSRPLINVMHDHNRRSECTDRLDQVYALLGLVDWQGRPPIKADYGRSRLQLAIEVMSHMCHVDTTRGFNQITRGQGCEDDDDDDDDDESLPFTWRIEYLLDALDITMEDEDISILLCSRQQEPRISLCCGTPPLSHDRYNNVNATYVGELFRHPEDAEALSTCVKYNNHSVLEAWDIAIQTSLQGNSIPCRKVYDLEGRLQAFVPPSTEPGDVLLYLDGFELSVGLVARRTSHCSPLYIIVGQVLFSSGVQSLCKGTPVEGSIFANLPPGLTYAFEAWLDPEDLLLFIVQGYGVHADGTTEMSRIEASAAMVVPRLLTNVVRADNEYSSFVRMRLLRE